jgi:hypothetical protein
VHDHKNKVVFFDSAKCFLGPAGRSGFLQGAVVKKLTIAGGNIYCGNAASKFEPAKPFTFLADEEPKAAGRTVQDRPTNSCF